MSLPRVLIASHPFGEGDPEPLALLEPRAELLRNHHQRKLRRPELIELLAGAVAVVASTEPYDDAVFEARPELRLVARTGVGLDSVDLEASVREGAFKPLGQPVVCADSGTWKKAVLKINDGRFANRCNGGDFRLIPTAGDLSLERVTAKLEKRVGENDGAPSARGVAEQFPLVIVAK